MEKGGEGGGCSSLNSFAAHLTNSRSDIQLRISFYNLAFYWSAHFF